MTTFEKQKKALENLDFIVSVNTSGQALYVIYDGSITKSKARKLCDEALCKAGLTPITLHFFRNSFAPSWVKNITPLYKQA